MATKRIITVDQITDASAVKNVFVSDGTDIKQIPKEKLAYDDTEIRQDIETLQSDISNQTIVNDAKGNIINVVDSSENKFVDFKCNHKNLLKITATSQTKNGITFTVNDDGTVTVNGTNTGSAFSYPLGIVTMQKNVNYFLSGCPAGGGDTSYCMCYNGSSKNDEGNGVKYSITETSDKSFIIYVRAGAVCNNLLFKPQLEIGTDITPYEPYSEDNIDISVLGKNFLKSLSSGNYSGVDFTANNDGSITLNGTSTSALTVYSIQSNNRQNIDKGTYTLKCDNSKLILFVRYNDSVGGTDRYYNSSGSAKTFTLTNQQKIYAYVTTPIGTTFNNETICLQLEKNSVATEYEQYKEPITATIDTVTQKGWEDLKTYKGTTNIIPKVGAYMELDYIADTKLYIDNKINNAIAGTQALMLEME